MVGEPLKDAAILIVDDQKANVLVLERLLKREGYTHYQSTTDPRQVLALYEEFRPDLILLDLLMPYLDGFAVLEQLRSALQHEHFLPIVVLTADMTPEARQRALSSGAKDFLTKPIDGAEVLLRIKNLLEMRQLYRQLQRQNQLLEERVSQRTAQLAASEERFRRRADEFSTLYDVTHDLAVQRDLPTLLETILERAKALLNVPSSNIYLYDDTQQELVVAVSQGIPIVVGTRLKLGEGMAGRVAQTRQPIIVEDYHAWAGRSLQFEELPVTAVVQVPLLFGSELIGVLGVNEMAPNTRRFTEDDIHLLTLFAGSVASVVQSARWLEVSRQQAARAEALAHTAASLNAQLDLQAVLKTVCEATAQALAVSATAVALYDDQHQTLPIVADHGLPRKYGEQATPTPRALYDEYARQMGPLIIVPDLLAQPGLPNPDLYATLDMRTVVSASLLRDEQLVGTLNLITFKQVRHFTQAELALLQGLADQAAQAIVNARLFAETERRLQRLSALRNIDQTIIASLDLNLTLKIFLAQVMAQQQVDAADVLLFNPRHYTLDYAAGRGFHSAALQHTRLRLGEGYAGRAAFERRMVTLSDYKDEINFPGAELLNIEHFQAYYGVPLIAKGQVVGVLEVFHRSPLNPDAEWLNFLEMLAGQAAIAIDNTQLFNDLQHSNLQLTIAYDATIEGWSRALDLRDKETEGHTQRVTELTVRLAQAVGVDQAKLVHLRRGALLHDIGKMGVPDMILLKPGPLTEVEWVVMRRHPTLAYELLSPIQFLRPALDIPYCHHEKWDGAGYPRGLQGEQIPLAARPFTLVDVWDALRSNRPYRAGWPKDNVLVHIRSLAGTHFDPQLTTVFLDLLYTDT